MSEQFVVLSSWKLRYSHKQLLEKSFALAGVYPKVVEIIPDNYPGKLKAAELRDRIAQEQARVQGEIGDSRWLLCMGDVAFGFVSNRFKLKGWIGTPLKVADRTCLATWEPAFLRGASGRPYLRSFLRHVERIRDLASGVLEEWSWPEIIVGDGNEGKLLGAIQRLVSGSAYVGCDIETNGGDLESTRIRCIGFGNRELAISIPYPFRTSRIALAVRRLLARDGLVFQNGVFDIPILAREGLAPTGKTEDLLHAHSILYPKSAHALAFIGGDETHADGWKALHAEDDDDEKEGWNTTDPKEMRDIRVYNAKDSCMQGYLFPRIYERLDPMQKILYAQKMEEDAIARRMMMKGFKLRKRARIIHKKKFSDALVPLHKELMEAATEAGMPELNLASPKQLQELYFRRFKVRPVKYDRDTGNPMLDAEALEKYTTHENDKARVFSSLLLHYRMNTKVLSTYIDKMNPWADGMIRATFKPSGTVTGRWSSARPNFLNQPPRIRDMYVADDRDHELVFADENALEGRTSALLAGADTLIGWLNDGLDIHTYNAKAIFDVEVPTKSQRNIAKLVFFASIYGAAPTTVWKRMNIMAAKLARQAGKPPPELIPLRTVEVAQKKLFDTHPQYPKWHAEQIAFAEKHGFAIEPFSGRKVPFFGFVEPNVAINHGSQGLAATIVSEALRNIDKQLAWDGHEKIVMFLYDEIGIQVHKSRVQWGMDLLQREMSTTREYRGRKMSFVAEPGHGYSWAKAKP